MRCVVVLLLAVGMAPAGPQGAVEDVMHPRSPETLLEVVFDPYYCSKCFEEGRIEADERDVKMMRMSSADLAQEIELDKKNRFFIETPHFKICSTITGAKVKYKGSRYARADLKRLQQIFPKLKFGREAAILNAHQRAHLYHIRVERLYAHFAALTENKKPFLGMQGHYQLFLLDDYNEYHTLTDKFIGRGMRMAGVQHHMKETPNFNMFCTSEQQYGKTKGKGDRRFNNWIIHSVAHNLVDGHDNYYREVWAWLEEGLAHYYERMENSKYNTFCWSEGKAPRDFLKPNWESTIFGIVRRQKDPPLSQWCEKLQPGELTGIENGVSWSIVKWIVETDPVRFTKMLRKLDDWKNKPSATQCINHAFGVSPSVLHQRWREYVLKEYRVAK